MFLDDLRRTLTGWFSATRHSNQILDTTRFQITESGFTFEKHFVMTSSLRTSLSYRNCKIGPMHLAKSCLEVNSSARALRHCNWEASFRSIM